MGYLLLDALGTRIAHNEDLKSKIQNIDLVDDRLNKDVKFFVAIYQHHLMTVNIKSPALQPT